MISFASDEIIRETMKYPEVFFMDCTAQVNKQKREFFFSVIRTSFGKCHLSNMTVIPSGNMYIYDSALFDIYDIYILIVVFLFPIRKVLGVQAHI